MMMMMMMMRGLFFFQFDGPSTPHKILSSAEMATTLTALLLRRGKTTVIKSELFRCVLSRSFASSSSNANARHLHQKKERRYANNNNNNTKDFPRVRFTPRPPKSSLTEERERELLLEEERKKKDRRTREEIIRDDVQRTTKRAHAAVRAANWNRVLGGGGEAKEEEKERGGEIGGAEESVPIERQKSIRVGILGVPNAGKSELVNALVGAKVSAVSRKTNTTRMETIGTTTRDDTQVVFLDLPGIVGPEHYRNRAHESKVTSGWAAASTCDAILFVVDANRQAKKADWRVRETIDAMTEQMRKLRYEEFLFPEEDEDEEKDEENEKDDVVTNKAAPPPGILVLNKVDLMDRSKRSEQLPELIQSLATDPKKTFSKAFPVSALHSVGTETLFNHLISLAKPRPWDYSPSESTAMNDRSRAIEVVRESVYDQVHKEICYGIEIVHKSWEDFRDGSVRIEHDLFVKSGGNRKIVVGKDGRTIGQIGVKARHVLEALLGRRVHLLLNVRVKRTNARYSQQFLSALY